MASLSDFGFEPAPAAREWRRERRDVHDPDESGLRPLPTEEASDEELEDDEKVELPVTPFSPAALFGIGAGIGVLTFAAAVGLYFTGALGRPALGPPGVATSVKPDLAPIEEANDASSLERARIFGADRFAPSASMPATQFDSPDIQVIDESPDPENPY